MRTDRSGVAAGQTSVAKLPRTGVPHTRERSWFDPAAPTGPVAARPTRGPGASARPLGGMHAMSDIAAAGAVALRKVYGQGDAAVEALRGVDVSFAEGVFTAIMGPSGSGKSTLLHCMAGLDFPTSGNVFIGETDLTTLSEKELTQLRRDRIGFIFQAYNLVPTLNASENITLPLDIAGRDVDRGVVRHRRRHGRAARPARHRPSRALGRPAAACRGRPRARIAAEHRVRRRADREPRLEERGGAAVVPADRRRRARPDDRDGHPRRARRRRSPTASCSWPTATSSTRCANPTAEKVLDHLKSLEG